MKKTVLNYRSIIVSDVHLGTPECKAKEVNHFLKHTRCEKLILNGDIIDGWSLKRKSTHWKSEHTRFIRFILKKVEKQKTNVVYLAGNHDEVLRRFLPLNINGLNIVDTHIHESPSGRYLVMHGDAFDHVTHNHKWISVLGDIGYQLLLKMNRFYNIYRSWRKKSYYSLSKVIKSRVKEAVNFVSRFEQNIVQSAAHHGCSGFICGHIHMPDNKVIDGIHYLNSGDWVESMSAIVEHFDGTFEVLFYEDFCERLKKKAESNRQTNNEDLMPLGDEFNNSESLFDIASILN